MKDPIKIQHQHYESRNRKVNLFFRDSTARGWQEALQLASGILGLEGNLVAAEDEGEIKRLVSGASQTAVFSAVWVADNTETRLLFAPRTIPLRCATNRICLMKIAGGKDCFALIAGKVNILMLQTYMRKMLISYLAWVTDSSSYRYSCFSTALLWFSPWQ